MSNPNDTSGAGLEGILQFGQSLAQNFFQFVNQQGAVPGKVPTMPESVTLPGAERMLELQRDLAARHAALWSGLMQSKPGETRSRWLRRRRAIAVSRRRNGTRARCSITSGRRI